MAFLGFGKKKTTDTPQEPPPPSFDYPPAGSGTPPPTSGTPPGNYQDYPPEQPYQPFPQQPQPQFQYPPQANIAVEQEVPSEYPPQQQPGTGVGREEIQEVTEAIVEEKWNEAKKEIDKLLEWKEQVATEITKIQEQINNLKSNFDSLHKGVLGKISEYDEHLTNVGTEIKAMEQVFSKILPSLTDSVNKLQRMSDQKIKSNQKTKKK